MTFIPRAIGMIIAASALYGAYWFITHWNQIELVRRSSLWEFRVLLLFVAGILLLSLLEWIWSYLRAKLERS